MSQLLFKEQDFGGRFSEWDLPKGFMFGGLAGLEEDKLQAYAEQFMTAADLIIDAIYKNQIEDFKVSNPVFYLYRHAIELYLKNILKKRGQPFKKVHSLHSLSSQVSDIPADIQKIIMEMHNLDPKSLGYRYNGERPKNFPDEDFCDAGNLKQQMNILRSYFEAKEETNGRAN